MRVSPFPPPAGPRSWAGPGWACLGSGSPPPRPASGVEGGLPAWLPLRGVGLALLGLRDLVNGFIVLSAARLWGIPWPFSLLLGWVCGAEEWRGGCGFRPCATFSPFARRPGFPAASPWVCSSCWRQGPAADPSHFEESGVGIGCGGDLCGPWPSSTYGMMMLAAGRFLFARVARVEVLFSGGIHWHRIL